MDIVFEEKNAYNLAFGKMQKSVPWSRRIFHTVFDKAIDGKHEACEEGL